MAHSNGSKRGHKRPRGGDMQLLGSMPGASSASGVLAQDSSAAVVPGLLAARHKVLSRKQRRKAARDEAKRARARAHQQKAARKAEAVAGAHNGEQGKEMQKKRKKRNKNKKKKNKQQRQQQQQQQHVASNGSDSDGSDDGQAAAAAAASRKRQRTRAPQAQAQQASPVLPPDDEDPEDAEIRRLEALLGISKGSGKGASNSRRQAYRQARKEFMEDGFEPDFVDFLADLDGIDKRPTPSAEEARAAAEAGSSASDDDAPEEISRRLPPEPANDDDDDEDEDEDDAEARARARTPAADKGVRVRDGSAAAAAGDGSAASDSEASDGSEAGVEDHSVVVKLAQQRRQRKQQHLYGNQSESSDSSDGEEADEAAAGGAAAGSGAYVPPHLRKRAGRTKAKQVMDRTAVVQRLRRRVQGVINRLSQANVQPMVKELVGLYADPSNSHREITDALRHIIMTSCCNTTQPMPSLIMLYAVVVAALHNVIGNDVGAQILEAIADRVQELVQLGTSTWAEDGVTRSVHLPATSKEAHNLLLVLAYLFVYHVVEHTLILDILNLLIARFGEDDIELVLLVLQHAGFTIRAEAPAGLRDFIVAVHKKADEEGVAASSSGGGGAGGGAGAMDSDEEPSDHGSRMRYMLAVIYDLKNNRQRGQQKQALHRGVQLRKWLGRYTASATSVAGDRRLRVRWSYLISPQRSKRWYTEGAAPDEAGQRRISASAGGASRELASSAAEMMLRAADAQLLELAKRQRMSTPVRRAVFVAMMGASSRAEAFERLMKLNLKGTQERQIVRVLMDCAAQERRCNPFYHHLALQLCTYDPRFKFTFQLAFWDTFKRFDELVTRTLFNLAKLLAHLIANFTLSLAVLKVADFTSLSPSAALFFRTLFGSLLAAEHTDEVVRAVFSRAGAGPDKQLVRDGVLVFLHRYMRNALVKPGASPAEQHRAKARLRLARRALEDLRAKRVGPGV